MASPSPNNAPNRQEALKGEDHLSPSIIKFESLNCNNMRIGRVVAFKGDLPVIARPDLYSPGGQPFASEVYAEVEVSDPDGKRDKNEHWFLAKLPNTHGEDFFMLNVDREDNGRLKVLKYSGFDETHSVVDIAVDSGKKRSWVWIQRGGEGDNYSWQFKLTDGSASLSVGESVRKIRHPRGAIEIQERHKTLKRRVWKAAGAVALWASWVPGGLADKAIDAFQDPKDIVQPAVEPLYQYQEYYDRELSALLDPNRLAQVNEEVANYNAEVRRAEEAVTLLMENLDAHNYDEIRRHAHEFEVSHQDQIISDDTLTAYRDRLEAAKTNEEVMGVFKDFVSFYGFEADFQQGSTNDYVKDFDSSTDVDDTRYTVSIFIDSLGRLPRGIFSESSAQTILLGNRVFQYGGNNRNGTEISLPVTSRIAEIGTRLAGFIDDSSSGGLSGSTLLHELGHSDNETTTFPAVVDTESDGWLDHYDGTEFTAQYMKEWLLRVVLGRPTAPSTYAKSNPDELHAEVFSGVLSDRVDGLAHPDVRSVGSESNKKMLRFLVNLERRIPGIANYLVSTNPRLIGRGVFTLGR